MPYTTLTSGNGQVKMLGDNSLVKCEFITHDGSPDGDTEGINHLKKTYTIIK